MSDWTTTGIDVSHWQDTADYASILKYMEFAFAKATEGTTPDAMFNAHIGYFTDHNVPIVGGYHFGRDDVTAAKQLAAYLARAGHLRAHFLDVEGDHAMSATQGRYFIDGMHDHGQQVGLYANESTWVRLNLAAWGQDWNFIANYTREPIHPYDVWQFGPAASNVDGDRSHHTLAQLRALMEGDVTPAPITDQEAKEVRIPSGTSLYDVDGKTFLRKTDAFLDWRRSPYGVGVFRAIFSPDPPVVLVGVAATNVRVPLDPSPFTQADVDADVALATAPLNATIAQLRTDVANADLAGRQAEWDRQAAGATVEPRLLDRP